MKFAIAILACIYVCKADLFEGDIILDQSTAEIVNGKNAFDAIKSETSKWTGGVVPYIFDSNFEYSRREVVKQAIADYHRYTCTRWVPRSNQKNYVKFIVGGGCYSYIGMSGGEQVISIGQGCDVKGIVMHEMMHCIGFWHEQSRLDRDYYIRIFWDNISNGRGNHNFKKYTHGQADYYGEGYDFDSVMHYGNWAFSKNNKRTIEAIHDTKRRLGQRDGFSQTDVRQLNKVYKCRGYENVKVPPPKGCIDRKDGCADWAKQGLCETNERWMLPNCCKTCRDKGTGGGGSACSDSNTSCKVWADGGHCNINPGYMLKNCKKSCRVC